MAAENYRPLTGSSAPSGELLQRRRSQLEELVAMVTSILYGMWRYRWPALVLAWGICAVGWTVVYAMPDVYRASTRVFIDAESMIKRAVGDLTVSGNMNTELNVLTRVMLSQPQLEKTARAANLDLYVRTPEEHEEMIANLGSRVFLAKEGGENIFTIGFEDSNRETAETVVRTLFDLFVEDALGERRSDSGAATEFVDQQIREYEQRLNDAEERRAEFKRVNIGLMPGETGDYYTRLQSAMQRQEATRAELRLARGKRVEYQQQLAGEEPVFGVFTPGAAAGGQPVGGQDTLIAQYKSELSTLLIKYTENHPDAIALQETIGRLEARRDAERARMPAQPSQPSLSPLTSAGPLESNPVYQRMRMGLSETEVEIATLTGKLQAAEAEVAQLQKLVDTIPEIERQLAAMNRDYDVTQEQYEILLKRRESLRLTGDVEQSGDQLTFRVIDEPRASLAPVGPDRPMLLVGTMVAAIATGGALAFLLQQLNPVFATRRELRDVTGLPVLGSLSLARNARDSAQRRRRNLRFTVAAVSMPLMLMFAVLLQAPAHKFVASVLAVLPS
jgi:polysaccharide chain length determinant protein (PEP-CTERM system associated)